MVSRAWCFGFGSGWGRQTCFSFALRRSKRWLPVFTNRKYSSSVRRTRGYLGSGIVLLSLAFKAIFSIFNLNTYIHSGNPNGLGIFLRSVQLPYAHKNILWTLARHDTILATKRNSTLNHCFDNNTKLPRHWADDLTIDSTCYQLTSPATSKQSAQIVIICQISVTVPRNSYERLPADQKI